MPSSNDINSDEYVAKLLSEDARKSSIKYSSMGLSALLPKRPTSSAPKPNTRFLQNILRETDNHNAALKKKEELEARLRLQNIKKARAYDGEVVGRKGKRRRTDDEDKGLGDYKRKSRRSEEDDGRHGRLERHRNRRSRRHQSTEDEHESYDERKAKKHRYQRSSHYHCRGRSRSSSPEVKRRHRRRRRSRSDSSTSDRHGSRPQQGDRERKNRRTHRRRSSSGHSHSRTPSPPADENRESRPSHSDPGPPISRSPFSTLSSSSSDPLESIVGPLPPPNPSSDSPPSLASRGRGSHRSASNLIDTHFSPTYNPTLDLSPSSSHSSSTKKATEKEKEDWDLALEALRDRAIWKQKGAERLRSAGFGEEEVRRWEESSFTATGSGREKGVEDVKWKGRGEEREWDVGKVVRSEDGARGMEVVGLEAAWTRKGKGKGGELAGEMRRALG